MLPGTRPSPAAARRRPPADGYTWATAPPRSGPPPRRGRARRPAAVGPTARRRTTVPILPFGDRHPQIADDVFVADGAYVIGDVTIGSGSSIWYNAVVRGDIAPIRIGRGSNIQDGSVVHVDERVPCVIGDHVVVGHGAVVHSATV